MTLFDADPPKPKIDLDAEIARMGPARKPLETLYTEARFDGPEYEPDYDKERLLRQVDRVRGVMLRGHWLTLSEIAAITGDSEASISAQLRHLRKPRFGSFVIEKRARGNRKDGLWEYRMTGRAAE